MNKRQIDALFSGIKFCETHEVLYVIDCAYCLVDRRQAPVVNLDNLDLNCGKCGHMHELKCNCGCDFKGDWSESNDVHAGGETCQLKAKCRKEHLPF